MLKIDNLHARVANREILKGLSLDVKPGEVHAIMGPNGAGKSTLGNVLSGREGYEVTKGSVEFRGQDLLSLEPEERAAGGVFLAFQYPVEIPGVNNTYFLRAALNAQRKARGEVELVLEAGHLFAWRDPAVALGVDPDEHVALFQVGAIELARRVRACAELEHDGRQTQAFDRGTRGTSLLRELAQGRAHEHPDPLIGRADHRVLNPSHEAIMSPIRVVVPGARGRAPGRSL